MDHCLGRGVCSDTMLCACDRGYAGMTCSPTNTLPHYFKESFDDHDHSNGELTEFADYDGELILL